MVDGMNDLPTLEELVALIEQRAGTTDPLSQLTEAVMVSGQISELSDGLLGHFITLARNSGASWVAIGERMGTSKQAAQKRFAGMRRRRGGFFLNRLTEDARAVVRRAVELAREMGSDEVQPDHVLLGLMEGSMVSWAVGDLGGSPEAISTTIRSQMTSDSSGSKNGHVPFSHRSKIALEVALREAIHAGVRQIGVEHVFYGILRDGTAQGVRVLAKSGITRKTFEEWLAARE